MMLSFVICYVLLLLANKIIFHSFSWISIAIKILFQTQCVDNLVSSHMWWLCKHYNLIIMLLLFVICLLRRPFVVNDQFDNEDTFLMLFFFDMINLYSIYYYWISSFWILFHVPTLIHAPNTSQWNLFLRSR